jgi:hypothetical protein
MDWLLPPLSLAAQAFMGAMLLSAGRMFVG